MNVRRGHHAGLHPSSMRSHDDDGISPAADVVIGRHGLSRDAVLGWADHYRAKKGVDFNRAPAWDFTGVLLGLSLAKTADTSPLFASFCDGFGRALAMSDYETTDGIMSKCLTNGAITDRNNEDVYDHWKEYAERLEGLNVALYRAMQNVDSLHRFIGSLAELDNYRHGRWRKKGDLQDRVPTTVGISNYLLDREAAAMVTYNADLLRDWAQPVRYSPYPRNQVPERERFGDEKDGRLAGECEVHVHAKCPIPAPRHIKIGLLPLSGLRRQEAVERYGGVGVVE